MDSAKLGREPLYDYGSLQLTIESLRADRQLDLTAANWREANPEGSYHDWQKIARACLRNGLHARWGTQDLKPKVLDCLDTPEFTREKIEFNTTPWFRVPGFFYVPKGVALPAPALLVLHEWGGPMLFGADRICGEPIHEAIVEHRATCTGGRALADWFATQGYCVLCIDAYHFGRRAPRGVGGLPESYDPADLDRGTTDRYQQYLQDLLYLGVRQLNWAGTTWAGVNFVDDVRCLDYLCERSEVDASRLGVTGLSGGGWRTNMLAALEPRLRAAVSVGWMTTSDAQHAYNVVGAIGTFCLLPGVWDHLDVPDLIALAAPTACMVVSGQKDMLFPPVAQQEASRHIEDAYAWSDAAERVDCWHPDKPHCYDAEIQSRALAWFNRHLKHAMPETSPSPER